MGILFIIYYLHYMLYMFTPTLYAFSQPLYQVSPLRCALLEHIRHLPLDPSLTTTKKHYIHLSSNVNTICILLTFNFNL
jgi:hypothetical protein